MFYFNNFSLSDNLVRNRLLNGLFSSVMIGSALRKVWIPLSVYKLVFKEVEPQKAVEPVLHALFPISTLSCSAVTGNPAKGIAQLDPNKIEALRGECSPFFFCFSP